MSFSKNNDALIQVLMLASEAGNDELVEILLQAEAQPEAGNSLGLKPIHLACKCGHHKASKLQTDILSHMVSIFVRFFLHAYKT